MRPFRATTLHLGVALVALVLLSTASPADARWTQGGSPLISTLGWMADRAYAAPDGGVVVVLKGQYQVSVDIERLGGMGEIQWGSPPSSDWPRPGGGGHNIYGSGLVFVPGGGFYLAWDDVLTSSSLAESHVLRVDALKQNLWGPDGILPFLPGGRVSSGTEICAGADGAVLVSTLIRDLDPWYAPWTPRMQRLLPDGTPAWGADGILVASTNLVVEYQRPVIVSDGAGGAFVVWAEQDQATYQSGFRVQRVSGAGVELWPAGGVPAMDYSGTPLARVLSDGAGGVYVCGPSISGMRVTHLDANSSPLWGAGGIELSGPGSGGIPSNVDMAADASGLCVSWRANYTNAGLVQRFAPANGAPVFAQPIQVASSGLDAAPRILMTSNGETIVVWRSVGVGLMANRLGATGSPLWSATGVVMVQNIAAIYPLIVSDGADGAIVEFGVIQNSSQSSFAQRIEADGDLPMLSGTLTAADDVANDEGGALALSYHAPYADAGEELPEVTGYNVWRLVSGAPAKAASGDATNESDALAALQASTIGIVRLSAEQAQRLRFPAGAWESLGFHAAVLDSQYRFVAATRNDTGPAVPNADEMFVVTAHCQTPSMFGVSNALSGHSIDNRAPAVPQQLAGAFASGSVMLSWAANTESDLVGYAVYRGAGASFVPAPGNRLAQVALPQHIDPAYAAGDYYKVTAVDRHGNESPVATLAPAQVAGVDGAPRVSVLTMEPNVPNPFNPRTTIAFSTPVAGRHTVTVMDLAGRAVVTLLDGDLPVGRHTLVWDGQGRDGGPLPSGVYFAAVRSGATVVKVKMLLVR